MGSPDGHVHRDIKPANIMLEENETVKICDFGIAKGFAGLKSGHAAAGQARLQALEKDATASGCLLIARKAATALEQKPRT